MTEYKNILIIQTAFIGDAILASSLVEKLHHLYPASSITILVRKGNESIYKQHPFLKETLAWNKKENKFINLFKLLYKIRTSGYDCVVNCHRFASSGLLAGFSGARHIAGYKQNPFSFLFNYSVKHAIGGGRHETERYNQLIEDFSGKEVYKPKLYPTKQDFESTENYKTSNYVCFAPASVWFTKQLPPEKWGHLSNTIPSTTIIYLLGGEQDKVLCEKIKISSQHQNIINLAGKLSLLQSCALIKDAQMTYVNDSAPLHLASSVNAPVTAFFLSTIPAFGFGPLSDNSTIKEVLNLKCRPCGLHGHKTCPQKHFKCSDLL